MKNELDALLCQRYPKIFANRGLSAQESCMFWGFSCGDGWFDLINNLCERLQFWTAHNGAPQVVALQVKEKFGTLSFYVSGADDTQRGMIAMASGMSGRICEECGNPGQLLVDGGWWRTCCEAHAPKGSVPFAEAKGGGRTSLLISATGVTLLRKDVPDGDKK